MHCVALTKQNESDLCCLLLLVVRAPAISNNFLSKNILVLQKRNQPDELLV